VLLSRDQLLNQLSCNLADVHLCAGALAHQTHHPAEKRSRGGREEGFDAPEAGRKWGKNHQSNSEPWTVKHGAHGLIDAWVEVGLRRSDYPALDMIPPWDIVTWTTMHPKLIHEYLAAEVDVAVYFARLASLHAA
jgi:hypothetical protein